MSFIPGPWRVASSNGGDLCVAPDTGNKFDVPICVMPQIVHLSVNEANANLIASAPELYEALAKATGMLRDYIMAVGVLADDGWVLAECDAALAKARGQ